MIKNIVRAYKTKEFACWGLFFVFMWLAGGNMSVWSFVMTVLWIIVGFGALVVAIAKLQKE